jgi:hypothetical protein
MSLAKKIKNPVTMLLKWPKDLKDKYDAHAREIRISTAELIRNELAKAKFINYYVDGDADEDEYQASVQNEFSLYRRLEDAQKEVIRLKRQLERYESNPHRDMSVKEELRLCRMENAVLRRELGKKLYSTAGLMEQLAKKDEPNPAAQFL